MDESHRVVGTDLVFDTLAARPGPAVASDIHSLPFADDSFDYVICVGSVANYLNLSVAAGEFARVLGPGGRLVLEYERSRTWSTLGTRYFGRDHVSWPVEYKDIPHELQLYSDRFVDESLRSAGLRLELRRWFHHLPSFAYERLIVATLASKLLPVMNRLPGATRALLAGNAIAVYSYGGLGSG